jgi:NADP-reducing hydrogenase subunit HndB
MATPLETLKKVKQQAIQELIGGGLLSATRIYVGMSTCEIAAGSKAVMDTFQKEIKEKGLDDIQLNKRAVQEDAI